LQVELAVAKAERAKAERAKAEKAPSSRQSGTLLHVTLQ
jgi:hypothetical protein